ncbi:MAG: YhjD/YihY/BrkB family envelope integrity protein, partial [Lapillicoccus sp.]
FPAVAIAAVVFGFVLRGRPELLASVGSAINDALPGFVQTTANPSGLIRLQAPALSLLTIGGIVAAVSLVLAAAGWIGSFRDGIRASLGAEGSPGNLLTDRLRDLGVFAALGLAFLLSAGLTSLLGAASGWVADHVGLGDHTLVVRAIGLLVGYAIDVAVLVLLLRVLSGLALPWPVVRQAALVGGFGLSVVKLFGVELIAASTRNPLLGSVALVIGLLFWLNLIARLVLLSACWAYLDIAAESAAHTAGEEVLAGVEDAFSDAVDAPALAETAPPPSQLPVRVIPPVGAADGVVDPYSSRQRDRASLAAGVVLGAGAVLSALPVVSAFRRRR